MATIAIVPSAVTSKRMLARRLAAMLSDAGHRVVMVVTTEEPDDPGVERRSLGYRDAADDIVRRWRPIAQLRANRAVAAAVDPARLGAVLDEVAADAVIVDVEEYEALLAALALPRCPPLAALCSFFEVWPIPGLGPDDPGPAGGPFARVRGRLAWWRLWTRMRLYAIRRHLAGAGTDHIQVAWLLAWRLRVRHRMTARQWLHPFAPADLPLLVCNALELDVPHRPRAGVVHIGSLLAAPADDPLGALPDDLAAPIRRARDAGEPIVLCSFGTVMAGAPNPVVEHLADVARLRPSTTFLVVTQEPSHRAALAGCANVHVADWLPQREVLTLCAAAVVHSGNATLHECVAAEVPVVVYPFPVNDQPRNAARVVRHGVGEVGDAAIDSPAVIAARLDRVVADPAIRARLSELAERVTRYERDGVAVAAVEGLLNTGADHVNGAGRTRP